MEPKTWRQIAEEAEQQEHELTEAGEDGSYTEYLHAKARIARRESWRDDIEPPRCGYQDHCQAQGAA